MQRPNRLHGGGIAPLWERRCGAVVERLARWLALLGGGVLTLLGLLTVASVTGRALIPFGLGPVPGDFELVEMGCAFAVFAFLPWCQSRRGHVTVDVFVAGAGPRLQALLALAGDLLVLLLATVVAWRLGAGLADKLSYVETSLILQMPTWWGYAAGMAGALLFPLVCLHSAWRSLNGLLDGGRR